MSAKKRMTACLLAGLILFVTLVSGFEIAREAHHVCVGAECRICAQITVVRELLKTVSAAVVLLFFARTVFRVRRFTAKPSRGVSAGSPVYLRVKLLN